MGLDQLLNDTKAWGQWVFYMQWQKYKFTITVLAGKQARYILSSYQFFCQLHQYQTFCQHRQYQEIYRAV